MVITLKVIITMHAETSLGFESRAVVPHPVAKIANGDCELTAGDCLDTQITIWLFPLATRLYNHIHVTVHVPRPYVNVHVAAVHRGRSIDREVVLLRWQPERPATLLQLKSRRSKEGTSYRPGGVSFHGWFTIAIVACDVSIAWTLGRPTLLPMAKSSRRMP